MTFVKAILTNNTTNKKELISKLIKGEIHNFKFLKDLKYGLFSKIETDRLVDLQERLGVNVLGQQSQPLKSMSSGEQKKLLFRYLLEEADIDYIILDEPFDCLDVETCQKIPAQIELFSKEKGVIQFASRKDDVMSFCTGFFEIKEGKVSIIENLNSDQNLSKFNFSFPKAINLDKYFGKSLVHFKNVSVNYFGKPVLKDVNWEIKAGEFWQLSGPNGSGKSTLIGIITGDNPKGYNQDISIFGTRKGSGESIWDIKSKIGYFSPAQIYNFKGRHSVLHMLISGFTDSVGLYVKPTELQLSVAEEWLEVLGMQQHRDTYFCDLSIGRQRILMCARAMVKYPPLLILDEPTVGLDDKNAALFVDLVNKIHAIYCPAIIFVSHRSEKGLIPQQTLELHKNEKGSIAIVV